MIAVHIIVLILTLHWLGDVVFQSGRDAENKWRDPNALWRHVITYTSVLAIGMPISLLVLDLVGYHSLGPPINVHLQYAALWAVINGFLHLIVDFVTSKWSHSELERCKARTSHRRFFIAVFVDQWIHVVTLIVTWRYFPIF